MLKKKQLQPLLKLELCDSVHWFLRGLWHCKTFPLTVKSAAGNLRKAFQSVYSSSLVNPYMDECFSQHFYPDISKIPDGLVHIKSRTSPFLHVRSPGVKNYLHHLILWLCLWKQDTQYELLPSAPLPLFLFSCLCISANKTCFNYRS